jgi:hypothetical protein
MYHGINCLNRNCHVEHTNESYENKEWTGNTNLKENSSCTYFRLGCWTAAAVDSLISPPPAFPSLRLKSTFFSVYVWTANM